MRLFKRLRDAPPLSAAKLLRGNARIDAVYTLRDPSAECAAGRRARSTKYLTTWCSASYGPGTSLTSGWQTTYRGEKVTAVGYSTFAICGADLPLDVRSQQALSCASSRSGKRGWSVD